MFTRASLVLTTLAIVPICGAQEHSVGNTNLSFGNGSRGFIENRGQVMDQNLRPNTRVRYLYPPLARVCGSLVRVCDADVQEARL